MGLPGAHGAVVTGVHGMGVRTPNAAAVAAATAGFAIELHIANGRIFTKGTLSMILAAGIAFVTRDFGSTVIGIGAIPKLHCRMAPPHTNNPILNLHPFLFYFLPKANLPEVSSVFSVSETPGKEGSFVSVGRDTPSRKLPEKISIPVCLS